MRTKLLFVFLLLGAFLCFTLPASAAIVSWDLVSEFSGAQTPAGTAPWGNATFEDTDTDEVTLTMTSLLNQPVGSTDEHFKLWYFNFTPGLGLTTADFTQTGSDPTTTVDVNENQFKADGDGYFDIEFAWANKTFDANGETVVFIADRGVGEFPVVVDPEDTTAQVRD